MTSPHHSGGLKIFEGPSVKVGRGYDNDLILEDPYVSPAHAVITLTAQGEFLISDTQSENGIILPSRDKIAGSAILLSGATIKIGQTKIRLLRCDHPVPAAKKLQENNTASKPVKAGLEIWYALTGFVTVYFVHIVANFPYIPLRISQVVFFVVLILLGMCFWAGLWAVLGRLIKHQSCFVKQLELMCVFMLVLIPVLNVCSYLGFIFASPLIEGCWISILAGTALGVLVFKQLTYATSLGKKAKLLACVSFPLVLVALALAGGMAFRNEFSPEPRYYMRVKPPLLPPVKIEQPEELITQAGKIFEELNTSDEFKN